MTLQELADLITKQQQEQLKIDKLDCEANLKHAIATIIPGKKYTKIDIGSSGMLMIDAAGNIYGIKGYGVINRGHYYGTLETANTYYWGRYKPVKLPT